MKFDYSELKGRIKSKGLTQRALADKIGMNPSTLSIKLKCGSFFSQEEIIKICTVLEIDVEKLGLFFYKETV